VRRRWSVDDIPTLSGRRALVTGATSGIGEHTALELARKGAEVVLAGRSEEKLSAAVCDVRRILPNASLVPLLVDLADLSSVRRAAARAAALGPLDLLVNNAGVMATPPRRTADGFELQMGTNHFGHFALTGLMWPQLVASPQGRVVTVSSQLHRMARTVPLGDPRQEPAHYRKWVAYAQSKLANLLFALELERRARAAGTVVRSMTAHPGYASTSLISTGLKMGGHKPDGAILLGATRLLAQSAALGAQPTLMAATLPSLPGGSYVGPRGPGEWRGRPTLVSPSRVARDEHLARLWWEVSAQATSVTFP
jgi:NAD(P)-dependent dehydrogenase (short-subunit alcohol dehydrogenase family)